MSKFENVAVVKEANVYFDGKVTSRTIEFGDGATKTLGIILPGEYNFSTNLPEVMEIIAGSARYRLSGPSDWTTVSKGGSFQVPGGSSFDITVDEIVDYCCSYISD